MGWPTTLEKIIAGGSGDAAIALSKAASKAKSSIGDAAEAASLKAGRNIIDNGIPVDDLVKGTLKNATDEEARLLTAAFRIARKAEGVDSTVLKSIDDALEVIAKTATNGGEVMAKSGADLGTVGTLLNKVTTYCAKKESSCGKLALVGLSVAGVVYMMIATDESDPGKIIGKEVGVVAGSAAEGIGAAVGSASNSFFDSSGLTSFFTKYGWVIGIFVFLMLALSIYSMMN